MTNESSHNDRHAVQEKRMQDWLDDEMSFIIALAMGADPNTCFDNAWRLFLRFFPELFADGGKFIEGWYVVELDDEVVMNEHGWCTLANGRIIDPTITLLPVSPSQRVYYYPGLERTQQEMEALITIPDMWFPYVRCEGTFGEDGLEHPLYKAAHDAARQKVVALANATTPPKKQTFLMAKDCDDMPGAEQVHVVIVMPDEPGGE